VNSIFIWNVLLEDMQTVVDDVFKELFVTVSKQCTDIWCGVISVPQLRASADERIQSDTISCSANAGPSRRYVYDQLGFHGGTEDVL